MKDLTLYKDNEDEYFNSNEIIPILGYKNVSKTLSDNVSSEYYIPFRDFKGIKEPKLDPRTILITKHGISELLTNTMKEITKDITELLEKYNIECRELLTYSYISNSLCFEYFVGYEIATLLGYKNPSRTVVNNVSKSNQLIFRDYPGVKIPEQDPKTILITREGACDLLIKTRKRLTPDILHILRKFQIETTNKKCLTKEQQTLSAITNAFKTEKFEDQYKIDNYYLDLYFTEYKLVIECDENGHADRKPDNEKKRMEYVNFNLEIDDTNWIRYNPDEYDFDISKVIGRIYRKMEEIKKNKYEVLLAEELQKNKKFTIDLINIFKSENPQKDFQVDKYNLDMYFPEYKLIVDIEENNNIERTEFINVALNLKDENWLIYNPNVSDFNLSSVIGQIFLKLQYLKQFIEEDKKCCTCRETKKVSFFRKVKTNFDGYAIRCKDCQINLSEKHTSNVCVTPVSPINIKICTECKEKKDCNDFTKHKSREDGLNNICKECEKNRREEIKNMEKVIPDTKECSGCKIKKTPDCFGKRAKSLDGLYGRCKDCVQITTEKRKSNKKSIPKNDIPKFKKCIKCNIVKTCNSFNKIKKNADGLNGVCKECKKPNIDSSKNKKKQKIKELNIVNKICSKCEVEKDSKDFVNMISMTDGLSKICKKCYYSDVKIKLENQEKINITEKKCNNCEEVKAISNYGLLKRSKDGHSYICKECACKDNLHYRIQIKV